MSGVVNTSTLIHYPLLIMKEYGIALYLRCWYRILSNRDNRVITFINIVME